MGLVIYIIICVLFTVLILWTWNNTKDFDKTSSKVSFIIIGIIILTVITLVIFNFSKVNVTYPNEEMIKEVRNIVLLVFVPVNGFISLPHIASIRCIEDDEKMKRRIIILGIVFIVVMILETIYLKDFQNGIMQILKAKEK